MQKPSLLIVGASTLAYSLADIYPHATIIGRKDYDLAVKEDCDQLLQDYLPDRVVLTHGVVAGDLWNMLTVNYTSAVYLMAGFYDRMSKGQIIVVGSATTAWQSWPGISMERLFYNSAKTGVSDFVDFLNRKNLPADSEKPVSVQLYEPNSFNSHMAPNSTTECATVAKELAHLIENPRISRLQGLNR